jgi:hypothetical protein
MSHLRRTGRHKRCARTCHAQSPFRCMSCNNKKILHYILATRRMRFTVSAFISFVFLNFFFRP